MSTAPPSAAPPSAASTSTAPPSAASTSTLSISAAHAEIGLALKRRLTVLRRRWLTIGTLNGLLCGLLAMASVFLFVAWLDLLWELSGVARWFSLRLAAAAGVLMIIAVIGYAHRAGNRRALAKRMDRAGETGGQILSGLDLILFPVGGSQLSQDLSAMAVEHAGTVSQDVSPWQVVPLRWTRIAGCALLLTAAGIGTFCLLMPALAQTQWVRFTDPHGDHPPYSRVTWTVEPGDTHVIYSSGLDIYATSQGPAVDQAQLVLQCDERTEQLPMFREADGRWRAVLVQVTEAATYFVRSGRARSPIFRIDVVTVPRLDDVRFRITPPDYTQLGPYEGPLPQGGLSGLPGAKVKVWANSNRPLSSGTLDIEGGDRQQSLTMRPSKNEPTQVSAEFEIEYDGKFRLRITDVDGQDSLESFGGAIHVLDDHRPFVRLRQPRKRSFATPNIVLPVVMTAEDDYGISQLDVFRSLNDSRALPQSLDVENFPRLADERIALPMSTYGLEPGDEIKLFARVEDNDPVRRKGSESEIATVKIISEQDFQRMLRRRKGLQTLMSKMREVQRRMANLAEEKKGLQKKIDELAKQKKPASKELRDQLRQLSQQYNDEIAEMRKLTRDQTSLDLEKNLAEHIRRLTRRLERQAKQMRDLADRQDLTSEQLAEAVKAMMGDLENEIEQFQEQVLIPAEILEQVYPLIEDQARFIQLVRRQRSLVMRLESLRGRDNVDDPAIKRRMRDFEEEQARIRDALVQLLDDIDNHVTALPEDEALDALRESAIKFVEDLRGSGAIEAMSEAELALTEFSGTRGHAKAEEAAEILEKFVEKSQQMAGHGAGFLRLIFKPGGGIELGDTIEQLLAGLGLLPGQKGGGGNGYSMRRSTLDNVGLYGDQPQLDDPREGSGTGEEEGLAGSRHLATKDDARRIRLKPSGELRAAGQGDAEVPVRYRRRVGAYFRRIADELGE